MDHLASKGSDSFKNGVSCLKEAADLGHGGVYEFLLENPQFIEAYATVRSNHAISMVLSHPVI